MNTKKMCGQEKRAVRKLPILALNLIKFPLLLYPPPTFFSMLSNIHIHSMFAICS